LASVRIGIIWPLTLRDSALIADADSMTDEPKQRSPNRQSSRQERLRAALRENLKRRKSQARGRASEAGSATDDDGGPVDPAPDQE
jgi:hypothetical protein